MIDTVACEVIVEFDVRDEGDAISRCGEKEWRDNFYNFSPENLSRDVLEHWATNAIANGIEDVSRLEGWADLDPGQITMRIDYIGGI